MIRPIDIRLNAAHPELPLAEAVTFTGSPSTVLIRGVPPNCGRWAITAVFVAATYPDGSTTTRAAVQSANGVWVATLPATARSGRTENGLRVMADGIDETGEAVTGYILGVADFAVASLGVTPAPEPGETSWQMLYFDAVPGTLRKGDVTKVDGVLKFYNGTAWEAFATPPALDDTVTSSSANGVKSSGIWSAIWGTASTAFSSLYDWCVAQLAGKLDKSGGEVTGDISMPNGQLVAGDVVSRSYFDFSKPNESPKYLDSPENSGRALTDADIQDSSSALGAAFAGKAGTSDLLAKLDSTSAAPAFSSDSSTQYTRDAHVTYNGKLYVCTTATTGGTWDESCWAETRLVKVPAIAGVIDHLVTFGVGTTLKDSGIPKSDVAIKGNIPYSLVTKTISNNAVTLDDRAINAVAVSSSLASLTVNFPTATSGKARDFGLRLTVASGITTAPELALPQGVVCENADGEAPEIGADGAATILYFTETASGVFLVKGEVITAIS